MIKRDLKKWERRAETSRNNGALGGRPPKETQPLKEEPKKPNGLINNPTEPRKPVNVTVTVTDTVNVTDKVKVIGTSSINTTHLEISTELHTSRVVISRLLKALEIQGKIKINRNKIEVLQF